MKKRKLFLDFDSTIVDSINAYCTTYNEIYGQALGFKLADPAKVDTWDLKNQCPLERNPEHIFGLGYFFLKLNFMPNALEVITKLSEKYDIIICSIGTYNNLQYKAEWLNKQLPFVDAILIKNQGVKMDKSSIDMKGAIFIDDHIDNLNSSNAKIKICFGKKYPWNEKWKGTSAANWEEVEKLLL